MAILEVLKLGDPILRSVAGPVTAFDAHLRALGQDMLQTMHDAPGVGLAAPQVGTPIRMFVYDDSEGDAGIVCNPVIIERSDETEFGEEGCLSIPGLYMEVERHVAITVEGQNVDGEAWVRKVEDFVARIWQHEIDHLDGILFIDRLPPEVRKEAMRRLRENDFEMRPPTERL